MKYPYFDYHDVEYQDFIEKLVIHLEPRFFKTNQIIAEELDESLEFYFVLKGTFDIGYEINKKKYYRIKFGPGNVIGAFNLNFHYRFQIAIRAGS
jgi:CRP-like cAMP-binding protein